MSRGRKESDFVAKNFTRVRPEPGKSQRWFYSCNHCPDDESNIILHRDNRLSNHILSCAHSDLEVKKTASLEILKRGKVAQTEAPLSVASTSRESSATAVELNTVDFGQDQGGNKKRKLSVKEQRLMDSFVERPMTEEEKYRADVQYLRYLIYSNIAFATSSSPYLHEFLQTLRPSYKPPSRDILIPTLLPAEMARVHILEQEHLQKSSLLTLMTDGWDDAMHRSLYGSIAAERGKPPTILGLEDITGKRGTAKNVGEAVQASMNKMALPPRNVIAMTTDDPSVMGAVRANFESTYPWIIILACFLHKLNGMIGKISAFPAFKPLISKNSKIVNFFSASHYWGGQLKETAQQLSVKGSLKSYTEIRWYSLILLCSSVLAHRTALESICRRPDALKKTSGLSPVSPEVIATVRDSAHWDKTDQLVRFCKPLVDAIGRIESRDASLADCMLELLRSAKAISENVENAAYGDSAEFSLHAIDIFNCEFKKINTDIHFLSFYLHPLCRKVAVSNLAGSRTFLDVCKIAVSLAKKLLWSEEVAGKLLADLSLYNSCRAPFTGGISDGAAWWCDLPVGASDHPLKGLATILFSIVPHSAEVERLFSSLGSIQSVKRSRLSVRNIEMLGKLRSHYVNLAKEKGLVKSRRHHTHSRIPAQPGMDSTIVAGLEVTPVQSEDSVSRLGELAASGADENLAIEMDELEQAFADLEIGTAAGAGETAGSGTRQLSVGDAYSLPDLESVEAKVAPKAVEDDLQQLRQTGGAAWDVHRLISSAGIA